MANIKSGKSLSSKTERKQFEGKKFVCNKCAKNLAIESNYFKLKNNNLCIHPIYPVCKACIRAEYERLRFEYGDKTGLKAILRKLDKPYIEEIATKALEREANDVLGYCIKTLNGLQQYSSMTYDDSDFMKNKALTVDELGNIKSKIEKFSDEEWERWEGYGLEPEEMIQCNKYYEDIVDNYEFKNVNDKTAVARLAVANVNLKKAYKEADSGAIERLSRVVSSLEGDLNIQAKQKKSDLEKNTFGNFIRMIEDDEPIPEAKDEFKDVDGIWKIVKRYIVGYLAVTMGKAREADVLEEDADVINEY